MPTVSIMGAAAWAVGRWLTQDDDLAVPDGFETAPSVIDVSAMSAAPRIARADRLTRLAAMVVARALLDVPLVPSRDQRSVILASTLASAHTNDAFERRRVTSGRPVPRDFPYTAANAAAGEIAAALEARGPSLALVGGPETGLAALERAQRWLLHGDCSQVIVIAAECPPADARFVAPPGCSPVECAAALVLEATYPAASPRACLEVRWREPSQAHCATAPRMLSVAALASVVTAWIDGRGLIIEAVPSVGASLEAIVRF